MLEVVIGYSTLGMLIAILVNKLAKRSWKNIFLDIYLANFSPRFY